MTSVSKHIEPIYGPLIAVCTYLMERFVLILIVVLFCKRHCMSEKRDSCLRSQRHYDCLRTLIKVVAIRKK